VAVARAVDYRGAGTVEFLLDPQGDFRFIEMNTRLQVEHAVTEAVLGVDLVEWQLRVAAGESLPLGQDEALRRYEDGGHAIEARLCAEEPAQGYLPQSGRIARWRAAPGVRTDHALADAAVVPPFYDSMLARVIAHAPERAEAAARLTAGLDATVCWGVATNRAFLARVLRDGEFGAGAADTTFLDRRFANDAARTTSAPSWLEAIAAASLALLPRAPLPSLWSGWSSSPEVETVVPIEIDGAVRRWRLSGSRGALDASCAGTTHRIAGLRQRGADERESFEAIVDGRTVRVVALLADACSYWQAAGSELAAVDLRLRGSARVAAVASGTMVAPMHGRVTEACVEAGATVAAGALLVVIEAMKMEHQIRAPHAGTIAALHVRAGDQVAVRQPLVEVRA